MGTTLGSSSNISHSSTMSIIPVLKIFRACTHPVIASIKLVTLLVVERHLTGDRQGKTICAMFCSKFYCKFLIIYFTYLIVLMKNIFSEQQGNNLQAVQYPPILSSSLAIVMTENGVRVLMYSSQEVLHKVWVLNSSCLGMKSIPMLFHHFLWT